MPDTHTTSVDQQRLEKERIEDDGTVRTITAITYKMSYDFVVKSLELSEVEKTLFLGGNARKFYGFAELPELPYIKNMSE